MRDGPDVTDAELAVLEKLWAQPGATIRDVVDQLYPAGGVAHYNTVQKLLERLEAKKCVTRQTGQLAHRFNAAVGLAPSTFRSLQRFVHVFRTIDEQSPRWVETALACGYYDQAHLIRDFRRFTGETPAALLSEDADLARHFLSRFGL